MVRRSFWMVVGAVVGVWMLTKVQRTAARLTPRGAVGEVQRRVRHLGADLTASLDAGRRAKQATELDLRQQARSRSTIDAAARVGLASPAATEDLPVRR